MNNANWNFFQEQVYREGRFRYIHRLEDERDRYKAALERIREAEGEVCGKFMECSHPACNSSYTSWAIADEALDD